MTSLPTFRRVPKVDAETCADTVHNRGPEAATLHVLPTISFRNTWAWDGRQAPGRLEAGPAVHGCATVAAETRRYGRRWLYADGGPPVLFTDNETNMPRLFGVAGPRYTKDGIGEAVVEGVLEAVNPAGSGTKAAADYALTIPAGGSTSARLRFSPRGPDDFATASPFADFDATVAARQPEADEFYATVIPPDLTEDARAVMRQSLAGVLWSKQYYHYVVQPWLDGDPAQPAPPPRRAGGRNAHWGHLFNADVISMPDKWEYPWYAAWDLAFHCVPLALVDAEFAKDQLVLMLREWYMHPNGQLRLRVGAQRRQPRCTPGRLARLQDRREAQRPRRPRLPGARLPEAAAQLHLVGQPEGLARLQRLRRGLPRPRQHRRLRSVGAAADRRLPRAVGRHQLDGDVCPEPAGDGDGAGPRQPGLRGRRQQVLGAFFSTSPTRWATRTSATRRRPSSICGTTPTGSSTTT